MKAQTLINTVITLGLGLATSLPLGAQTVESPDPYLWLEEVQGERALNWARERNAQSQAVLEAVPGFADTKTKLLEVLNNRSQIPTITRRGAYVENFWRDASNKRGLWRRTTLDEYRKAEPQWETLIDLDALALAEKENWVWANADCLAPDYTRCMVSLSRGGADATVVREYDLVKRAFVPGGFALPEAKTQVDWLDADTLLVGTDFGPGSMTKSGYARVIKQWKRGTPLTQATVLFEGAEADVSSFATVDHTPGFKRVVVGHSTDFYNTENFVLQGGKLVRLDIPSDAALSWRRDWAFLQIKSDLVVGKTTYGSGSMLAIRWDALLRGERNFDVLFAPTATRSLDRSGVTMTRDHLILGIMDNVAGRLEEVRFEKGAWVRGFGHWASGELAKGKGAHDGWLLPGKAEIHSGQAIVKEVACRIYKDL